MLPTSLTSRRDVRTPLTISFPITLGVTLIVIIVALIVGWVLLTIYAMSESESSLSPFYWILLTVGSLLFLFVLVGVVMYLSLSIKAINLTRRQSNFIDSVTHELKSPIASLKLYLQTMSLRDVGEEQQKKFQKFMMEDVERLDGLISHLLDAGNIEKKRSEKNIGDVRLDELITGCAATVCARYRVAESTINLDLKPCLVTAQRVDAVMIFQNLLDNAVKYAGSPPKVHVTLRTENENVIVEISDNGEGIPEEAPPESFWAVCPTGRGAATKKTWNRIGTLHCANAGQTFGGQGRCAGSRQSTGNGFRSPIARCKTGL